MTAATAQQRPVLIHPEGLKGFLGVPPAPLGVVIFAHGSGSGRLSPRNQYVASGLRDAGLATLLVDLLTPFEEGDRATVFDIDLLAERLLRATDWLGTHSELADLPIGYFGASTGGGAALRAAADQPARIAAIVSRGGRPDLAGAAALARVRAPTQLIVGSLDTLVMRLNRAAMDHMRCVHEMIVVRGAGHLFEEAGALDAVIVHARHWFQRHLGDGGSDVG